jgi:CRISPR/Cas system endoribonuclease Cas6 (RAMP superfamily)
MKQILVTKNSKVEKLYGQEIELSSDTDSVFGIGTVMIQLDINLSPISGKGTFDMYFKPSENLAQWGIALVGAYKQENLVRAYFWSAKEMTMPKGTPLLVATLFEPVVYRQVDMAIADGTVSVVKSQEAQSVAITPNEPTPKKRGGRRKKL